MVRLSAAEGARRHRAIRQFLEAEDYAAYIVFTSENFVYVTNFLLDVAPWERPVAAIFPRSGEPSLILNELSTNHFRLAVERGSCWVSAAEIYVEHPRQADRAYTRPEWDRLFADVLRRHGLGRGRIACDSLGPVSPAVRAQLPDVTFQARPELIRDLRLVKSQEELDLLRACGELSDWAQREYQSLIAPGEYIMEVGLEVQRRLGRRAAECYPEEDIQVRVVGSTGVDTACPHRPGAWSGRRIAKGDGIVNVIVVRINGYGVENERTFFVGAPSEEQRRCFDVMYRAQAAATAAMVEGNRICDIDAAAQRIIEAEGLGACIFHRTGHGIGIGGHEYPDDTAFNYAPLKAGMVFSSEPGIYVPGLGGFRHSDTVIVGRDGPEPVTRYPRELDALIVPA